MATAKIPESAQFSNEAEYRNKMYTQNMLRLQHLAWRALNVLGKKNDEIVVICIQVDSYWRELADSLVPNCDWQAFRDMGQDPIARGSVTWDICKTLAEELPDISDVIMEVPPKGKVRAIVLSDYGGTVYELEPKPEDSPSA